MYTSVVDDSRRSAKPTVLRPTPMMKLNKMQAICAPEGVLKRKEKRYVKLVIEKPKDTSSTMKAPNCPCSPLNAFVFGKLTIKMTNIIPIGT